MASISLRHVTRVFDHHIRAVSDLSLEIGDAELMVLVGPSGCGKTTTLNLIAGLDAPTSGEIRIADRVVDTVPPRERDIAMVFQDSALYPHLSVYENLAFALRMRKLPAGEIKRRIEAAAETLGIVDLLGRRPASLSGGQRQRVALGRAMARQPAAFLLDEPLTNLDAPLRLAMRSEIKALQRRLGTTTLYVTHDPSEAMALGERICVLRRGQVQQVGRPDDIYHRPANRFVAGFFGVPPMNLLSGRIRAEHGSPLVELGAERIAPPALLHPCLTGRTSEAVVLGIRPHDLSLEPLPGQQRNALLGLVSLIEPFGSRVDLHVRLGSGEHCIVSGPPRSRSAVGQEVRVYVDLDGLHLFAADDAGANLLLTPTEGS